jgi:hypothetical protein
MNIDRYTLQSASFNDNAHLSPWIPVGTEIHDERLTVGGHMPLYRYDGHIPSVEEVRAWASKRMGPSPRASTLGARLLFLSLAVVFGIALYRRGRTQRSS